MDFSYITAAQRESLYNEVWEEPVVTVAKRYGMSDNGLRKHLKRFGIPLPPPGYWARIAAGQKVSKKPLPEVSDEAKKYVCQYVIKYKEDYKKLPDDYLHNIDELGLLTEETQTFIREMCSDVKVPSRLINPHKLITDHESELIYRNNPEKRQRDNSRTTYSARINGRYVGLNPTLPIHVSPTNLKRVYRLLDTTIKTLEEMESRAGVSYEFESNKDIGAFAIMRTCFHFEINEVSKGKSKNNDHSVPKLLMKIIAKGWMDSSNNKVMEYKDEQEKPIESQLGQIIYDMFVVANQFLCLDILYDRKLEKQMEEEKRQRRLEQMRKGELAEINLLEQASADWDKAEKIRRFADAVERKIFEVNDEEKKDKLIKWLKWARDKADWIDPLTAKEDELLGKSKHLFESI